MEPLTGRVQHYPWGSTTAIPALLGIPEDGRPWAELWLGAHASAPARVGEHDLDVRVADSPGIVGDAAVERFGPRLPYLMKVLAAAEPLSLQAHPTRAQAEAGFAREEAAGIPATAPHRNYSDDWPKPEALCALDEMEALYGFADPTAVADRFAALGVPAIDGLVAPLRDPGGPVGLREVFLGLGALPEERRGIITTVVAAAAALLERSELDPELATFCRTAVELASRRPDDPGVVAALLMNRIRLSPGEAIYLAAGNLHAYLHGTGVEVMANSDNVLRGGLTGKHVDVAELGRVLDFSPVEPQFVPIVEDAPGVQRFDTPAPEFRLWRIDVTGPPVELPATPYGRILLVTDGRVTVGDTTLARGESGWLTAGEETSAVGRGTMFLAAPGLD